MWLCMTGLILNGARPYKESIKNFSILIFLAWHFLTLYTSIENECFKISHTNMLLYQRAVPHLLAMHFVYSHVKLVSNLKFCLLF
jgi:hypothetical protein